MHRTGLAGGRRLTASGARPSSTRSIKRPLPPATFQVPTGGALAVATASSPGPIARTGAVIRKAALTTWEGIWYVLMCIPFGAAYFTQSAGQEGAPGLRACPDDSSRALLVRRSVHLLWSGLLRQDSDCEGTLGAATVRQSPEPVARHRRPAGIASRAAIVARCRPRPRPVARLRWPCLPAAVRRLCGIRGQLPSHRPGPVE